jgi:hypothetical protein
MTGHGLDDWGSITDTDRCKDISLRHHVQTGSESSHPVSYRKVLGFLYPEIKRSEHETNHTPPSNTNKITN